MIKVAAWNIEGRLTRYAKGKRGNPEQILRGIKEIDTDLIVLPEAYIDKPASGVDDYLRSLGYELYDVAYGDQERDWSKEFLGKMPSLRVLSRIKVISTEIVRFGGIRNLLVLTVVEPETGKELLIIATHLDDRAESNRLKQTKAIIEYVKMQKLPVIMLGDFNATWSGKLSHFLQSSLVRFFIQHITLRTVGSLISRGVEMTTGQTLELIEVNTHLIEADPLHRPTATLYQRNLPFLPYIPLLQIDHILMDSSFSLERFTIKRTHHSDHYALEAVINFKL